VKLLGRPCMVFKPDIFEKIVKVMKKDWLFEKRSKLNQFAMQAHVNNGLNVWLFSKKIGLFHRIKDKIRCPLERLRG